MNTQLSFILNYEVNNYWKLESAAVQMQHRAKGNKSTKKIVTEKGSLITGQSADTYKKDARIYGNRRVITETSQKCLSESIKNIKKQFKLPFKSVSPKPKNVMYGNKIAPTTNLKKVSKIKSPNKSKGITETGPTIKKKNIGSKPNFIWDSVENKHRKSANNFKLASPLSKKLGLNKKKLKNSGSNNLLGKSIVQKKSHLKTQGSFDSTTSCLFFNQVDIIGLIGQGTFGQVFKGRLKQTGEVVAIKRVLQDKKYKNRETQIVNMLNCCEFVMKVLGTYITYEDNLEYLNIIMTHYDCDLYYYIKQHEKKSMPNQQIKLISYQIFRGLLYIHSRGICHRDIKPHNMLLKGKNAVICDFGSAKILKQGEPNLPYICSRCYRAPQLIFGATQYTNMIDIWSMGCVILEMMNKVPLFIGESSVDHLSEVIKVMGTPTKTQVVDMNPEYDLNDYKFPKIKKRQWSSIFPKADPVLIDLISQIMLYSPKQRLTAAQALAHQYYDQIRQQQNYSKIVKMTGIDNFFEFTQEQLQGNEHLLPKLIPQWYIC